MRPLLALVHGIRITSSEESLFAIWRRHLRRGCPSVLKAAEVDLLYWVGTANTFSGHPLANLIRALGDDLAQFIMLIKRSEQESEAHTDAALALHREGADAERRYLKAMTLELVRRGRLAVQEAIDDGLLPLPDVPQPRGVWALTSRGIRRLSRLVLDELHAYLYNPKQRVAIREEVWRQLAPQLQPGRPTALVGHSLGALIVMDLLETRARAGDPLHLDLVVTMGNPVGFPAIYERLPQPVQIPPGIRRWVNIAAYHDLVAVPPQLGPLIAPCPVSGVAIEDFSFTNPLGRWTWLESFHRAEGYLESRPLAEALEQWLEEASSAKEA